MADLAFDVKGTNCVGGSATIRHFDANCVGRFDIWVTPYQNIIYFAEGYDSFSMLLDVFLSKIPFPAKAAVIEYILRLCCLKIFSLVAKSCICRVPQATMSHPGKMNNFRLLSFSPN